jgi:hypothetical protein
MTVIVNSAIFSLRNDQDLITDPKEIRRHIYQFYIDPMGLDEPKFCSLANQFWPGSACESDAENNQLAITFSMEELESLVKDTKTATAPRLDGFPVAFFKKCWPWV